MKLFKRDVYISQAALAQALASERIQTERRELPQACRELVQKWRLRDAGRRFVRRSA